MQRIPGMKSMKMSRIWQDVQYNENLVLIYPSKILNYIVYTFIIITTVTLSSFFTLTCTPSRVQLASFSSLSFPSSSLLGWTFSIKTASLRILCCPRKIDVHVRTSRTQLSSPSTLHTLISLTICYNCLSAKYVYVCTYVCMYAAGMCMCIT